MKYKPKYKSDDIVRIKNLTLEEFNKIYSSFIYYSYTDYERRFEIGKDKLFRIHKYMIKEYTYYIASLKDDATDVWQLLEGEIEKVHTLKIKIKFLKELL